MTLRHWISTSIGLGVAAALGLVLCALALQDIFHGEADVRNEWWAVRISLFLMGLFIAATFVTLVKVRRAAGPGFVVPAGSAELPGVLNTTCAVKQTGGLPNQTS